MKNYLEEIYKSSIKLLEPLSLEQTYKTIVSEAIRLIPQADNGSIFIEVNGELRRVFASSNLLYAWKPRKRGYLFNAFKNNEPKILTAEQVKRVHPQAKGPKFRSDIVIPLSYKKEQLGLLTIYSNREAGFAEKDLQILKLFGPLATLSIINNKVLEETRLALETRDLFISLASHELRTPLTTLSVYSQLLKKKIDKKGEVDKKWIDIINDETKWLNILFNELLTVNQIRKGDFSYTFGKNHLNEIIERSINHINVQFPENEIKYKNNLNDKIDLIYSDFDKLLQVFVNLLTNAAKFSNGERKINLSVLSSEKKFKIRVEDKGKGIDKRDLPYIFKGFYKGRNHMVKGMGLGLYISKKIIKEHKGIIDIKSVPGKGTKVLIELPR